jgi:hypothetical protein
MGKITSEVGRKTYLIRLLQNFVFPQSKVHEDVVREPERFFLYFGGQKQAGYGNRLLSVKVKRGLQQRNRQPQLPKQTYESIMRFERVKHVEAVKECTGCPQNFQISDVVFGLFVLSVTWSIHGRTRSEKIIHRTSSGTN